MVFIEENQQRYRKNVEVSKNPRNLIKKRYRVSIHEDTKKYIILYPII